MDRQIWYRVCMLFVLCFAAIKGGFFSTDTTGNTEATADSTIISGTAPTTGTDPTKGTAPIKGTEQTTGTEPTGTEPTRGTPPTSGTPPTTKIVCNPDNSIEICNLPADYYYFAMQNVTGGPDIQCNVTNINSTAVTITGCSKDLPILLTFGTFSSMGMYSIHGGRSVVTIVIQCRELPIAGNKHSIVNSYFAGLALKEQLRIEPSYYVTSSLNTTSAVVGSHVGWTISFPSEYILEVTACRGYPGTNDTSPVSIVLISSGGCNVKDELISHFIDNMNGTATATLMAFKFFNYDNVYLKCDVKICPAGSSSCDTACSRGKRSALKSQTARETRETSDVYEVTVNNVLNVVDIAPKQGPYLPSVISFTLVLVISKNYMMQCIILLN